MKTCGIAGTKENGEENVPKTRMGKDVFGKKLWNYLR
jgi:hypothetical protein